MAPASLKDVAAASGVSFQTVSKVLNGAGSVAPETRRRILEVADDLGYLPDATARGLVTRRTRLLGVVVGDLADETLARFVVGAEREAEERGYALAIVSLAASYWPASSTEQGDADDPDRHERSLQAMLQRRVDGLLLAAPQMEEDKRLPHLLGSTVPVVSLHSVPGGVSSLVGSDHQSVGRVATEHLLEHGHRRVGVVAGPQSRRVTRARLRGHEEALRAAGATGEESLVESLVEQGDWTPAGGAAATERLLAREPGLTALIAHNDLMAVGVLHTLHRRGQAPPAGVAVVSVDDIPIAAHTVPPLTSVRVPFTETGAAAAGILIDCVEGNDAPARHLLPVSLARRESCGCPQTAPRPTVHHDTKE